MVLSFSFSFSFSRNALPVSYHLLFSLIPSCSLFFPPVLLYSLPFSPILSYSSHPHPTLPLCQGGKKELMREAQLRREALAKTAGMDIRDVSTAVD